MEAIYINDKTKRVIIKDDYRETEQVNEQDIAPGQELRLMGVNWKSRSRKELLRIANFLATRYNCMFDQEAQENHWDEYDEIALAIHENRNRY